MSGLDNERLNAIRARAEAARPMFGTEFRDVDDIPFLLSQLAAVSADRDREAERADRAEQLLTKVAIAWEDGDGLSVAHAIASLLDWYTSAAMKAGQQ